MWCVLAYTPIRCSPFTILTERGCHIIENRGKVGPTARTLHFAVCSVASCVVDVSGFVSYKRRIDVEVGVQPISIKAMPMPGYEAVGQAYESTDVKQNICPDSLPCFQCSVVDELASVF